MFWKKLFKNTNTPTELTEQKQKAIFVCQFCGGFISHMSTPCTQCNKVPSSTTQIIQGVLMSSDAMNFPSLKATAQLIVETGRVPQVVISRAEEVLLNPKALKQYEGLFHIMSDKVEMGENSQENRNCYVHNTPMNLAEEGCFSCLDSGDVISIALTQDLINKFSLSDRIGIALGQMNKFLILMVDYVGNPESFENYIKSSTYDLYLLKKYPNEDINLRSASHLETLGEISSPGRGFSVTIQKLETPNLKMDPNLTETDLKEVIKFTKNYNFIRKVIV